MPRPSHRVQAIQSLHPLDDHLRRSQETKRKMAALVKTHGLENCQWALDQIRAEKAEQDRLGVHPVGRKRDYDPDALRDVWVFVEARRALTNQSVSAICAKAKFKWIEGGADGAKVVKEIHGATLRRLYYRAADYLKAQSRPAPKRARAPSKAPQDVETWWRQLVAEQVERLSGKDR